jgi:hypothetical protein
MRALSSSSTFCRCNAASSSCFTAAAALPLLLVLLLLPPSVRADWAPQLLQPPAQRFYPPSLVQEAVAASNPPLTLPSPAQAARRPASHGPHTRLLHTHGKFYSSRGAVRATGARVRDDMEVPPCRAARPWRGAAACARRASWR